VISSVIVIGQVATGVEGWAWGGVFPPVNMVISNHPMVHKESLIGGGLKK